MPNLFLNIEKKTQQRKIRLDRFKKKKIESDMCHNFLKNIGVYGTQLD